GRRAVRGPGGGTVRGGRPAHAARRPLRGGAGLSSGAFGVEGDPSAPGAPAHGGRGKGGGGTGPDDRRPRSRPRLGAAHPQRPGRIPESAVAGAGFGRTSDRAPRGGGGSRAALAASV